MINAIGLPKAVEHRRVAATQRLEQGPVSNVSEHADDIVVKEATERRVAAVHEWRTGAKSGHGALEQSCRFFLNMPVWIVAEAHRTVVVRHVAGVVAGLHDEDFAGRVLRKHGPLLGEAL